MWKDILKINYEIEFQLFTTPDRVRYRTEWGNAEANTEQELILEMEELKGYAEKFHEDMVNMHGYGNSYAYRDSKHHGGKSPMEFTNELYDMTLVILINDNIVATLSPETKGWVFNYGKM
tara:strand:+ start:120 stop:479 length:360 start_codon:yes stop_codon:yes gene_type:complete